MAYQSDKIKTEHMARHILHINITCDDKLIKQAKKVKIDMLIMNPIDYVRKEK